MLSTIFSTETTALESQITELQNQIVAAQTRIAALGEVEFVASGALQALTDAVQKVSALAPNAIVNLRTAVLNLFNSGDDNSGNDDGNQPNPEPQPDNDGGAEIALPTQGVPTDDAETAAVDFEPFKYLNSSCPVYFEGHWETATPDGSRWEIASVLACLLEDCPAESLKGQAYELLCDREDKGERFCELVKVSDAVAYQRRHDGEIICVYAGFNNKGKLRNWGEWLSMTHSVASKFELRAAKRLTNFKYELKLWGMTIKQIERLAGCDFSKEAGSTGSSYSDAPVRQPARTTPRACEIDNIGVGDRIRSVTVKIWEYTVLALREDGTYDCERIGVTPAIRLVLHPASVELVSKAVTEAVAVKTSEQQFIYSVLKTDNHLGQKLSVSRNTPEGKQQFLGSVSCGSDNQKWSHSRQPKYGQGIPYFPSKEAAAAALAEAYERDSAPRLAVAAGIEPSF